MDRSHEDLRESIGAYLLGALPNSDAAVVERHLDGCAECRAETDRLRPAVEILSQAVPAANPPRGLRRSVMAQVRAESRGREGTAPARPGGALSRLALRARPAAAWAAAATLAVGLAAGYGVATLTDDDDRRVIAASVDRSRVPDARASLEIPAGDAGAVLRVKGMPQLGRGRVYQVWLKRDGEFVPGAAFQVRPDGSGSAAVPEGVGGFDTVLLTRERNSSARAPGEKPVLRVRL